MRLLRSSVTSLLCSSLLLLTACTSTEGPADSGIAPDTGPADTGTPPADAAVDAGEPDTGVQLPPTICDELGLAKQPMQPGASTYEFGAVAGDFTIKTLEGDTWNLADHWTGCESYLFVNYIATNSNFQDQFWDSRVDDLVLNTPVNAHIFFLSWERTQGFRDARLQDIKDRIVAIIYDRFPDEEDRLQQFARFHYANESVFAIEGSIGAFITDYIAYQGDSANAVDLGDRGMAPPPLPWAFGIDRDQEWDSGGSMNEYVGGPPALRMASYLPHFYNHKADLRDQQAAETGVETLVLLDERVSERIFVRQVNLPSASEMDSYDTVEFDVTVNCPHRNVFGCSEWDRIGYVQLCLDGEACEQRTELVRWITPYWRRGERRWIMDASSLRGFVKDGGPTWFRLVMGPGWERATERDARFALRLADKQIGTKTSSAVRAFTGGSFNDQYNDREPFSFTPPASATKVELVVIVSGHGQDGSTNCSEWCDHRHQFAVNGTDLDEIRHEGSIGSTGGCGPLAAQGVPPGQYGNWAPERAYWCPGLPVNHIRVDITDKVTLGQANSMTYSANFRGGAPGGGNIDLTSYVVWSE